MSGANGTADPRVGHVYCCQPQYSGGIPASHRQFWRGGGSKYPNRTHVDGGCSLLANGFNRFWVHALNLQESGLNITHFVMMHDDVVPQDGWIDVLMDAILEAGVDVMAAVVPIKDWMGLTSCAIDGDDGFKITRRITLKEVFNLPDVFSAEDCGYPEGKLLVNTGCWVCDFTKPWRHAVDEEGSLKAFFTIRDRIRKSPGPLMDGSIQWIAEVDSEDWGFSRRVQALGATVRATRRVQLSHYGQIPFNNQEPWGACEHDTVLASRFGGKSISKPGYVFTDQTVDVPGWLTDEEGKALGRLAKGKVVLEIGSYCGRSTIWMARTADQVFALDTFDGRGTPEPRNTLEEFKANLLKYGVLGNVTIYAGESRGAMPGISEFFDLAFVDGSHDYASVQQDIQLCMRVLKPGGRIAFHDYTHTEHPGVMACVDTLRAHGWVMEEQADSIIVLRHLNEFPNGATHEQASEVRSTGGAGGGEEVSATAGTAG